MELGRARKLAERLRTEMAPFCARVEVAGSIRRGRPEVKDLELVATPNWGEQPGADLFGTPEPVNLLYQWALGQKASGSDYGRELTWIKPGTNEIVPWQPKPDGKYWRAVLAEGIKLDLFLTAAEQFGIIYLIRTGSAEFSQAVVTHAKRIGKPCHDGALRESASIVAAAIPTPEESDVFRALGLQSVPPEKRTGPEAVRRA